jgi:crotonobetaine/carnitine-CoA ligase
LTEVGLTHYTRFPERRPGSCGRTHEDWEADVVDARGLPVDDGEIGEIVLRPRLPSIMMNGYINKAGETVHATRDLWFHTGDYGRRDSDGYYYFVSRAKERIRRRGENITPSEVERIIAGHQAVADCAALAHPARDGEDDVRVVVVARDSSAPPSPTALMDWLQGRMPFFMMPRYIEFAPELPRNPAGKLEKYKLLDAGLAPDAWDREAAGYVIRRGPARYPTNKETS